LLKPTENPPMVWPEDKSIREFEGTWWVAHTRSRNEKAFANDLLAKNVSYFLPMTWKVQRKRGRILRSLLPLFNGYLFFCGNEKDRLEALKTNRVANILEVKDQKNLVNELYQIEKTLAAGASLEPHQYVKSGQCCRVIAGSLQGLEGVVAEVSKRTRLILRIEMLGQAASVEIDRNLIEVIDERQYSGNKGKT